MARWTIDTPTSLTFDGVVALRIRLISGSVAVLAAQDRPRLDVESVSGQPLLVVHDAGILTITYEDMTWDGVLGWLRPQRHSASIAVTVPKDCPTQLSIVNAAAVVSGMSARTSVKSVSGGITMDGVTGVVDATTVSGYLEAQDVHGEVAFKSVSGDLTIAGGSLERLDAKTINGRIGFRRRGDAAAWRDKRAGRAPFGFRAHRDRVRRPGQRSQARHNQRGRNTRNGRRSAVGEHDVWLRHPAAANPARGPGHVPRGHRGGTMSPVFGHGRLRLYLLKLLDEAPRHGYEVIRLLQDRFMGVYAPSPGT